MVSVRIITIKGKKYVQVAEYKDRKTKVLKSFGSENQENLLRAAQFAGNYNTLDRVSKEESKKEGDMEKLLITAEGVFGFILGIETTKDIVKKYRDK